MPTLNIIFYTSGGKQKRYYFEQLPQLILEIEKIEEKNRTIYFKDLEIGEFFVLESCPDVLLMKKSSHAAINFCLGVVAGMLPEIRVKKVKNVRTETKTKVKFDVI